MTNLCFNGRRFYHAVMSEGRCVALVELGERRQVPTEIHSRLDNTHVTSINFYRGQQIRSFLRARRWGATAGSG